MKNKFLWLLILGVVFFASCDDDDKAQTYSGDNLTLSVSGFDFSGREAVLDGSVLTLKQALPGESETVFSVTREGDKITGINSNSNREIILEGSVDGDKLDLNLILKAKSSMTAKWGLAENAGLFFNVETDQEEVVLGEDSESVDEFVGTVESLGSWVLPYLIRSISLEEDGNIVANYLQDMSKMMSDEAVFTDSPKGMALYNVVDDKIYVVLDINGIIADATAPKTEALSLGRADYNPLTSLISMAETGIPLYLRDGENGTKEVYVDREFLLPIIKMLPALLAIYGEQLGDMKEMVEGVVMMLSALIENSTKTELGLRLVPFSETEQSQASVVLPENLKKVVYEFVK